MAWRIYGEKIYYLRNQVHKLTVQETLDKVNAIIGKPYSGLIDKTLKRWEDPKPSKFNKNSEVLFLALADVLNVPHQTLILESNDVPESMVSKYYMENRGSGKKRKRLKLPLANPNSKIRLAIFDFDGTLFTNYTFSWKEVWRYLGYKDEIRRELYRQHKAGEITYSQWCDACVFHYRARSLSKADIKEICKPILPVKNLYKGLEILKKSNIKLAIVSGGIDAFMKELLPKYSTFFDDVFINKIHFDEENIIRSCTPTAHDFIGKKSAAIKLCNKYGLQQKQAAFTGDQGNDESLWTTKLTTIAFNAPEGQMRDSFQYIVDTGDFLDVVKVILEDNIPLPSLISQTIY